MDGSEIDVGKTNADEGYRWANTFLQFVIIPVFEDLKTLYHLCLPGSSSTRWTGSMLTKKR